MKYNRGVKWQSLLCILSMVGIIMIYIGAQKAMTETKTVGLSYPTLVPVSTWMGDRLRVGTTSRSNHPVDSVVYPMQVQMMAAYRWIQSPSRLAWSEGWRPFGA